VFPRCQVEGGRAIASYRPPTVHHAPSVHIQAHAVVRVGAKGITAAFEGLRCPAGGKAVGRHARAGRADAPVVVDGVSSCICSLNTSLFLLRVLGKSVLRPQHYSELGKERIFAPPGPFV